MSTSETHIVSTENQFRGQNLQGQSWSDKYFQDGNFQQVQANQTTFHQIRFERCSFHAAVIRESTWSEVRMDGCHGRFLEIENTSYQRASFDNCQFESGSFFEVDFQQSLWSNCDLSNSDLRYSSFNNASLQNVNLNNCDLANVDFTGCTLDNVTVYNARITNAIGLTDEQRDHLLASGAYEGLPPAINKLRKRGLSLRRQITDGLSTSREKFALPEWLKPSRLSEWGQEVYEEWKTERERQRQETEAQEEAWKQEQDERRQRARKERLAREERRKQEKEASILERERLQQKRQQESLIQQRLLEQQDERNDLQQEIAQFFEQLEANSNPPTHIQEAASVATNLYQQTETALAEENRIRESALSAPLDEDIQASLISAGAQTQRLAQQAMDAQQEYFEQLQNWKRSEQALLQKLQEQALQQSALVLLQQQEVFDQTTTEDLLEAQMQQVVAVSTQSLEKARLELEQETLRSELESLQEELKNDAVASTPDQLDDLPEDILPNTLIESDIDKSLSLEDSAPEISPERLEQITLLSTELSTWLVNNVSNPPLDDVPIQSDVDSSKTPYDSLSESYVDTETQSSSDAQLNSLRSQLDKAFDDIDQQFPGLNQSVDSSVIEEIRRLQQANAELLLASSQPHQEVINPTHLERFQTQLIQQTLEDYTVQITEEIRSEKEAQARQQAEQQRLEAIEQARRERELERQQEEQTRIAARETLAAQQQSELDALHKDRLRTILDTRYSVFQETLPTPSEEVPTEPVGFKSDSEVEERASIVQYLQSMLSTSQVSSYIETSTEAYEAEQRRQTQLKEKQALQQERALLAQQQAEQKRQQRIQRQITLQQKAERAREQALAEAQQRKDDKAQQRQERQQQRALEKQQREAERAEAAEVAQAMREQRAQEQAAAQRQLEQERKSERLAGLKSQLFEEARRQEYQEIEAQIEADVTAEQRAIEVRRQKQSAFLEQLRREEERRANDPLLLEQQRQQEILARKQERLQRLQTREREIQEALLALQAEYESDNLDVETVDLNIEFQSPWQQRWYRFTDLVSSQSPDLAAQLDGFKENLEENYVARRAQARFFREQQKQQAASALEEKRKQEHQERLARLATIRKREEVREQRLAKELAEKTLQEAQLTRQRERLAMSARDRHSLHRSESTVPQEGLNHARDDFRGETLIAIDWSYANLHSIQLSGAQLDAANLIHADLQLAFLDYARMRGSTLDSANLNKANLEGVSLYQASLRNAELKFTRFYDADIREADFKDAILTKADLSGTKATHVEFSSVQAEDAIFAEMELQGALFKNANLNGASFHRSNLTNCIFDDAIVTNADFRGSFGLTKQIIEDLEARGALVQIEDASDRYGTWGAPQLRAAIVLFALGVGSLLLTTYLDGQDTNLESLEQEAQLLRTEDAGLAAKKYEALAEKSQVLDEQVQYYIEAATLAEKSGSIQEARRLFELSIAAADLNTELNSKARLRYAQFLLTHSDPEKALTQLRSLMDNQSLSTFQRAKLIFYTEQSCRILNLDASAELSQFYAQITMLPEVEADLHMALSDLRLQQGQTVEALEELAKAEKLEISEGLTLRLIESKARAHDRLGNLNEAIEAYQALIAKAEPNSNTTSTAMLALADLLRRQGSTDEALTLLQTLESNNADDGRLISRSLLIQGRLLEEQDDLSTSAEKYKLVLDLADAEPETKEEARVSLARLLLQGDGDLGELPLEIRTQAQLGEARSILDQGQFEEALTLYSDIIQTENTEDNILRAARSGMAEALSNLGKHQEANEIWETLLRENLDPVESQHIEVLLAYSKLQSGDLDGAKLAFQSLQKSSDALIRYQGQIGFAETAVLSGEFERAKEIYTQVLQDQPSQEIQIQVWQEMAQIATEQDATEDILLAWRNILQISVDDEALRSEAHTSIARALAQMERLDEAIAECEMNLSTAEAQLQCAIILDMAEDPRALERYTLVANNELVSDVLRSEAALGAAKLTPATDRAAVCEQALNLSQIDPIIELQLIQLYLETPEISAETTLQWQTRQETLAQGSPQVLVQYLMERTSQLRSDGELLEAARVMNNGLRGLPESLNHPLQLELADMYLELENTGQAQEIYQRLLESPADQRLVRAGLARTYIQQEDWEQARNTLANLPTDVITGTEIHMMMQINQNAPTAKGLEIASQWATLAPNPDVQWEALMEQGHQALAEDAFELALEHYTAAADVAVEPRQKEWAQLSMVQCQSQGEVPSDLQNRLEQLNTLKNSDDREVQTQATIQMAQILLHADDAEQALTVLSDFSAQDLGAGWDMTVEELRATAYLETDDFSNAKSTMQQIQTSWPEDEQVQIPSAMMMIQIYQREGLNDKAQAEAQAALAQVTDPVYKDMLEEIASNLP